MTSKVYEGQVTGAFNLVIDTFPALPSYYQFEFWFSTPTTFYASQPASVYIPYRDVQFWARDLVDNNVRQMSGDIVLGYFGYTPYQVEYRGYVSGSCGSTFCEGLSDVYYYNGAKDYEYFHNFLPYFSDLFPVHLVGNYQGTLNYRLKFFFSQDEVSMDINFQYFLFACLFFFAFIVGAKIGSEG